MANRSIPAAATLALACMTMIPSVSGQQALSGATRDDVTASEGIRTDRLTPRQLRTWRSVEQIIQAVDRAGRPLHPRLFSLWRWAQISGHAICIELLDDKNPPIYHAGFLTVQAQNGDESKKIAVIQLFSWIIEKASEQKEVQRPDGFIPFDGLGKLERYAQVVGHELAHAALQLEDPAYSRLCRELEIERSAFLASRQPNRKSAVYDQTMQQHLARLQSLTEEIEAPAQSTEVEIWRELLQGQGLRAGVR